MFEGAIAGLTAVLIFIVGLLLRAMVAVAILAAVIAPIAAALLGWTWIVRLVDRARGLHQSGHLRWRDGCFYTPGHLWLRPRGDESVRIGVDDVAQRVLPAIKAVTLPTAGTPLKKGETLGEIQCADGLVTLRAPLTGVVEAVNERVTSSPKLLHQDPYRRAWLVEMHPTDDGYRSFLQGDAARTWLMGEDKRLTECLEHQLGVAAADGGELMLPPHRLLTTAQWRAMRQDFLEPCA